jgi:hypothetical protein
MKKPLLFFTLLFNITLHAAQQKEITQKIVQNKFRIKNNSGQPCTVNGTALKDGEEHTLVAASKLLLLEVRFYDDTKGYITHTSAEKSFMIEKDLKANLNPLCKVNVTNNSFFSYCITVEVDGGVVTHTLRAGEKKEILCKTASHLTYCKEHGAKKQQRIPIPSNKILIINHVLI